MIFSILNGSICFFLSNLEALSSGRSLGYSTIWPVVHVLSSNGSDTWSMAEGNVSSDANVLDVCSDDGEWWETLWRICRLLRGLWRGKVDKRTAHRVWSRPATRTRVGAGTPRDNPSKQVSVPCIAMAILWRVQEVPLLPLQIVSFWFTASTNREVSLALKRIA